MHARSFLTTLAMGYLALGVDAKCRHKSRTHDAVTTPAGTATLSPSGFTTILTGSSSTSTGSLDVDSVTTTTTAHDSKITTATTTKPSNSVTASSTTTAASAPNHVFDAITKPSTEDNIHVGDSIDINWTYDAYYSGKISIDLIGGATQGGQQYLGTIITGLDNSLGTYRWTISQDFVTATGLHAFYGLSIKHENGVDQQYSMPLHFLAASA